MKLHVHQSSRTARLMAKLTHITSGLSACSANVRLHALPTALDTLLPLDGSLCNLISFIGLATTRLGYDGLVTMGQEYTFLCSKNTQSAFASEMQTASPGFSVAPSLPGDPSQGKFRSLEKHSKRICVNKRKQRHRILRRSKPPWGPKPEGFLSLESTERGIASMNAVDKALRIATVHILRSLEVLRFSLSDKRIAMERVRTR